MDARSSKASRRLLSSGNQISYDFIGGCGHAVLLSAGEKKTTSMGGLGGGE
jgi:predicted ATP-grasp superfamily ATP-dependent carboligase